MMSQKVKGSFRDPMGYVYQDQGVIYRKIMPEAYSNYDFLMESELYLSLTEKKLLVPHEVISRSCEAMIIQPMNIPFISYPYEWCFSQYQDAALLTLEIQKIALGFGLSLKDASAYNIQFYQGRPIFIDTLSFEKKIEGKPWVAYKQFCQHFLGPLTLMSYTDFRLQKLMSTYIDGLPLDLVSKLLSFKSKLSPGLFFHLHLHAKYQEKHSNTVLINKKENISTFKLKALIDNLEVTVKKLRLKQACSQWSNYYEDNNYEDVAFEHKKRIISSYLDDIQPKTLLDLGGNDGRLTTLATNKKIHSVVADIDPLAVEQCYQQIKKTNNNYMMPLIFDLINPSADIGWHNQERERLVSRIKTDGVMALALIHHLVIANNIPLPEVVLYFSELSNYLIIEFIPKTDSMVKKLLAGREDIFPEYSEGGFERYFLERFCLVKKEKIACSDRILYLLKKIG